MPGHGEQHKSAATSVNPFEEVKPHIGEYTAQEIATLSSRLEKKLGPEYISSRPGAGGGKVHYLSADKCINLANEVFGFNGWSSAIQRIQIDFVDESQSTGKVSLGLSVIVRVTLRDGTFHEDIGYGHIENCKGKAAAFEKAKKEGTTDGLKRALRNFGNLLGNCVYDKEYVAKVTKLKVAPSKWDPENLHRHPDFAPIQNESAVDAPSRQPDFPSLKSEWPSGTEAFCGDPEDEFGSDDFDEADFSVPQSEYPDGVILDSSTSLEIFRRNISVPGKGNVPSKCTANFNNMQGLKSPLTSNHIKASDHVTVLRTPVNCETRHSVLSSDATESPHKLGLEPKSRHAHIPEQPVNSSTTVVQQSLIPDLHHNVLHQSHANPLKPPSLASSSTSEHNPPIRFVTARAAESLQNGPGLPMKAPAFDPHLESPSIRKTAGIDHTKTKPVGREAIGMPPQPTVARANFVNPLSDKVRRVGMPMAAASPLQNRGSYKLPQMKRPLENNEPRVALSDVTNVNSDPGEDLKRQKVGSELQAAICNERNFS